MSAELVEIATRAFRLACDNKTSKLCDPALEGLRLLFATGLVQGATEGWAPKLHDASPEPSSSSPTPSSDDKPAIDVKSSDEASPGHRRSGCSPATSRGTRVWQAATSPRSSRSSGWRATGRSARLASP